MASPSERFHATCDVGALLVAASVVSEAAATHDVHAALPLLELSAAVPSRAAAGKLSHAAARLAAHSHAHEMLTSAVYHAMEAPRQQLVLQVASHALRHSVRA